MEYNIKWKPEENGDHRRNREINEILADTMEELFPLEAGATILEIGGGNGAFAEVAAGRGYVPTVLDCDEDQLKSLPSSVATISADWASIEESDPQLAEKYHVVISNFNTAVQSVDELRKMNHTAAEWCIVNRLLMYKEPMIDRMAKALDLPVKPVYPKLKQDYIQFNTNSVIAGHRADVHFNDLVWENQRSVPEAADRFLSVYYSGKEIPEGMAEQALKAAEALAVNGIVSDPVSAHVAHLHWNVNYR